MMNSNKVHVALKAVLASGRLMSVEQLCIRNGKKSGFEASCVSCEATSVSRSRDVFTESPF